MSSGFRFYAPSEINFSDPNFPQLIGLPHPLDGVIPRYSIAHIADPGGGDIAVAVRVRGVLPVPLLSAQQPFKRQHWVGFCKTLAAQFVYHLQQDWIDLEVFLAFPTPDSSGTILLPISLDLRPEFFHQPFRRFKALAAGGVSRLECEIADGRPSPLLGRATWSAQLSGICHGAGTLRPQPSGNAFHSRRSSSQSIPSGDSGDVLIGVL